MAQIVCIAQGTHKSGVNSIDDIISIHDDDVDLSGAGYAFFKIYKIKNATAKEIEDKFNSLIPEIVSIDKHTHHWIDDDGQTYEIKKLPKYMMSMLAINEADETDLKNKSVNKKDTLNVLDKCQSNIKELKENRIKSAIEVKNG